MQPRDNPVKPAGRVERLDVDTRTQLGIDPSVFKRFFAEYVSLKLLRPQDMLSLELQFYNFTITDGLLQRKPGDAFLVVLFEPQSIGEECGTENMSGGVVQQKPPVNKPARAMLSGKSRLVFVIPDTVTTIPLIATELLNWNRFKPKVNARANVFMSQNSPVPIGPPDKLETALEIPFRLLLSPTPFSKWLHTTKLKPSVGLINPTAQLNELWHTRLFGTSDPAPAEEMKKNSIRLLRAIWSDDANPNYAGTVLEPGPAGWLKQTSIGAKQRHDIVHETSNFNNLSPAVPLIQAKKVFLTALGGWLDSNFQAWSKPDVLTVESWRHLQTMAREHYVEVVDSGYILPFGHKASLVTITERKPHLATGAATTFQRGIIIITEPVKTYEYRHPATNKFLEFPFNTVEIVTTSTPLLDASFNPNGSIADARLVIRANKQNFCFQVRATDYAGNTVDFSLPMSFVKASVTANPAGIDTAYQSNLTLYTNTSINKQKVALAQPVAGGFSTVCETNSIRFGVKLIEPGFGPKLSSEPQNFLPIVVQADIIEPAYQRLTGNTTPLTVTLVDPQATQGTKDYPNPGEVFAKALYSVPAVFSNQTDKSGGFVTTDFSISGLSRKVGAFGGTVEDVKKGIVKIDGYFDPNKAKLFGVFKLRDLFEFSGLDNLDKSFKSFPKLTTQQTTDSDIASYTFNANFKKELPANNIARLTYLPEEDIPEEDIKDVLRIDTKVITPKNGNPPQFITDTHIRNFSINILPVKNEKTNTIEGLLNINFKEICFKAGSNVKTDVSVEMDKDKGGISFGGPLKFLNGFTELIQLAGFSPPPYLDVTPSGIRSGYTLELPNLQLGAFMLSHLSLGAEVNLPFTGGAFTMGFRFCERHQPFTLTVGPLGGGGFFGIEATMQGLRHIEASIEFGAAVALNLTVASGAVSIMGGIYFKAVPQKNPDVINTQLTGYVRINGAMRIIGLITASVEFYMALSYESNKNKAYGKASLKIQVTVLFFSKSVPVETSRTFAGSGEDPSFGDMIESDDWDTYWGAFAA